MRRGDHLNREASSLDHFHPLVSEWFAARIGRPTDLQLKAWPRIAAGEHLLISAPTGTGKTLAAFLWAIDRLITRQQAPGPERVLYVSPLKALNNDVRTNLLRPLAQLRGVFNQTGDPFPDVRVGVRSGDTPQSERRRMQRHPPEILITTPESLNLMLSSRGGRTALTGIATVILDEIHAVINDKRGVHLITAVERLVPLNGEFQRIALSATLRPPGTVARFVGGYIREGSSSAPRFKPRPMTIVESVRKKDYRIRIRFPEEAAGWNDRESFWQPFVADVKAIVLRNRSTLIFTKSRGLCEKLTRLLNQNEPAPIAYAHHGSLSREIRTEVERRLKAGQLRAIVATGSLELGIDIGTLDEVVLFQPTVSVSAAIQRIGRAGHRVDAQSRGTFLPLAPPDIVQSAVLADGVLQQDIEPVHPVEAPLDVLAQIIVSMVAIEDLEIDEIHARLQASFPYHSLSRARFDLVLQMLAGRYAGGHLRELQPRIAVDGLSRTATARKGALQSLYLSGGTIPDRGYFHLRHLESGSRIGELDEEFVWEAKIGQAFTLGTQDWRVERITHNDVWVLPARPGEAGPPFWKAEEHLRDYHLSERIGRFLEAANARLEDPQFPQFLVQNHRLDPSAADQLIGYLKRQKAETRSALPHRHHVLIEHVRSATGGYPGNQMILHTLWGGRVNRPFGMILEAAWQARYGHRPEIFAANDALILQLPQPVSATELLSLIDAASAPQLLRRQLEGSGFFGARFRECAGRALLLTRRKVNERMPLWLNRLRSQKLLESVLQLEDFPILLETWRTCLKDAFDLDALVGVLTELQSGEITWTEAYSTHPSPMAQHLTWPQINEYMYRDDSGYGRTSRLRTDLLNEVALSPGIRPTLPGELANHFALKRQRLAAGYAPDTAVELIEWVKERLLLTTAEWRRLLDSIDSDTGGRSEPLVEAIAHRLVVLEPRGAEDSLVAALEELPRILSGFYGSEPVVAVRPLNSEAAPDAVSHEDGDLFSDNPDAVLVTLLSQWLQYHPPQPQAVIARTLGLDRRRLETAVAGLVDSQQIVSGALIRESDDPMICDRENYEIMLRMLRARARPSFEALSADLLPLFMATFQGIATAAATREELLDRIEQLICRPAPAVLWETELLPARAEAYEPADLDLIMMQQGDLLWLGAADRSVCFCFEPDLDLLQPETEEENASPGSTAPDGSPRQTASRGAGDEDLEALFPDPSARYEFSALMRTTGLDPAGLGKRLWRAVWQGMATNDTFGSLRHGIATDFRIPPASDGPVKRGRRRRTAFSRWSGSLPRIGNWMRINWPPRGEDPLDREERNKDRARILLDRYGILFRPLLKYEPSAFSWPAVFRALRLMELSGEVVSGYFFDGLPGPQFISHRALRLLKRRLPRDAVYWISAADPASVCGMGLAPLKSSLTRRVAGSHLVYHGENVVLISRRNGKRIEFRTGVHSPHLNRYLGIFEHLLNRKVDPLRRIVVERINGAEAARSPYAEAFQVGFDVERDYRHLIVYRRRTTER